jgi:hypothetical protein
MHALPIADTCSHPLIAIYLFIYAELQFNSYALLLLLLLLLLLCLPGETFQISRKRLTESEIAKERKTDNKHELLILSSILSTSHLLFNRLFIVRVGVHVFETTLLYYK